MSDWIYPYVHDNSSNLNPDKTPYWSYVHIGTEITGGPSPMIRLTDFSQWTRDHRLVTYIDRVRWYTTTP